MNSKTVLLASLVVLSVLIRYVITEEMALDFTLSDIDGVEFSLSDYRGKVVLLDFFASGCGSCVIQISHLKSVHEEFDEDLIIMSISVLISVDTVERLQQFRQEHEIDWIVARDTIGLRDEYNVTYLDAPVVVLIDQEGYIRYQHLGVVVESVLREKISELVEGIHDIDIMKITPSKTVVEQGYIPDINVTVLNQGNYTETFNLTLYYDMDPIETQALTLNGNESNTLAFIWNTTVVPFGNYTLKAEAEIVPSETDTADNTLIDGWLVITILGDLDGNFKVTIKDIAIAAKAFGSYLGHPGWNVNADMNSDGEITIKDIATVAIHFGEES